MLATLALAGCATLTPARTDVSLEAFKAITNSAKAPCPVQREIAAHNTVYDTLKGGKAVTYKAPCDVDKPAAAIVKVS